MKFLPRISKKQTEQQEEKTVLFVCVENAGRSQMAEGLFRKYAPRGYLTVSAGTKPSGEINPIVIQVMRELGVDIIKQKSKIITEDMIKNSSIRVNMGWMEKESCPTLFIHNLLEWRIEDPKGKSIEKVREIRDDIEKRVRQLATDLVKGSPQVKH
jgi:arsenate reductase